MRSIFGGDLKFPHAATSFITQLQQPASMSQTLAIIKPDAFASGNAGKILAHLETAGFRVVAARVLRLTTTEAQAFYAVHRERPFYAPLVAFMTSGPCLPMVLDRDNAVAELRRVIGATDPAQAETGTVRSLYAESKERNAIHASDSDENAEREARFFFAETEMIRNAG
jgi:nucleoside-diphosphate kinase